MRYFEDLKVGDNKDFDFGHQFTEQEIISFASQWDPQPFHIDPIAAADSMFGGIVACSSHIISASMSLGNRAEPVAAVSALGFSDMKVLSPIRPGDQIRLSEQVIEARLSKSHQSCGIVTMRMQVYNQNDILVFEYASAFLAKTKNVEDKLY